uniref:RNA helicase n=1 Tax=Strigamia maritima TaxID=126957 RepID=T1IZ17_STRMM
MQSNNSPNFNKRMKHSVDTPKTNGVPRPRNPDDVARHRRQLPTFAVRHRLLQEIEGHHTVIILGETGSGKTTQIPQYLYETKNYNYGMIAITQPRRIAAITVAKRVAFEVGTLPGALVGHCVRFDDVTSPVTKLKYMTDGMLLREALLDPLLMKYSVVILDEAHERTVQTDVLFGIVKTAQSDRKRKFCKPLRIIVMSATMDVDSFSSYFNNAPVLYLEGRQYPVQIMYAKENQSDYLFSVLVTVFQIHQEQPFPGDILVFLTGQDEINSVIKHIKDVARFLPNDVRPLTVLPLYASLPAAQQMLAVTPISSGARRVIVATNVAETSITLSGVKYVVDSGLVKVRFFSPVTGLDLLKIQKISKAQAWQRAGRAGRESSGICYRLYTESLFFSFNENSSPEIQRCSLASIVLQILVLGIDDPHKFDFMDKPTPEAITNAIDQLHLLGAVDKTENQIKLTHTGKLMSSFPVDPCLAKIILASKDLGCTDEILTIISMMSVDSVTCDPTFKKNEAAAARKKFQSEEGDLITLLKIFQAYIKVNDKKNWCHEHFLLARQLKTADDTRKQLVDLCTKCGIISQSSASDLSAVRRCFARGLFMNSAELQPSQDYLTRSLCSGTRLAL